MAEEERHNIALFIDADNTPASKIDFILSELARYGTVNMRRAYGNWTKSHLKPWHDILHENAIQPIQQFDVTKQKNASDIALTIDVMDTLYTKGVDIFCLVSSDADFTPVATRVRAEGKIVLGFGEKKAPEAFRTACSNFLYLNEGEEKSKQIIRVSSAKLKQDTKLVNLLRQAVEAAEDEQGWAIFSLIGSHIKNRSSFDQRNYGYSKLSDLFLAIDLFEVKEIKTAANGRPIYGVKNKERAK